MESSFDSGVETTERVFVARNGTCQLCGVRAVSAGQLARWVQLPEGRVE